MKKVRRFATCTIHGVPLVFDSESGERTEEKFDVVYRSYSNKALKELAAVEAAKVAAADTEKPADDETGIELSSLVGLMVATIKDADGAPLTDDTGEDAKLGSEFFASMRLSNVRAIYDAIQADINPPLASSEPGPSGSGIKNEA